MNLEIAIRSAIDFETRVRNVYREAARDSQDAIGRKVFGQLAQEEQGHLDYLGRRLAEWLKDGTVELEPLATSLPAAEELARGIQAMRGRLAGGEQRPAQGEIELLQRALQAETETRDHYRRLLKELGPEDRKLFERFEAIEDGHLAIVAAELDQVKGLGFWFDHQEFDLQNG